MQEYNIVLALEKIVAELEVILAKLQEQSQNAPTKNRWINGTEVLLMLRISDSTLKRMRKNKQIPCEKIGKSYYYPSIFFEKMLLDKSLKKK
jgi:predicted DNA-binding transcriptional regulator AlpA